MASAKFLVGVMYSGEREYADCLAAIGAQKDVSVEIFRIENRPNKQAHDELYAEFNRRRGAFDILAKIDADMVLAGDNALAIVAGVFAKNPRLDHLSIDVFDFLSNMAIPAQNFYSGRVEWKGNSDPLIVDYHGTFSGLAHRIMDNPISTHMGDPDDFQAFGFGVHRCLKAIQPQREAKNFHRGLLHWTIVSKIYDAYVLKGDVRRLYALAGATLVLEHPDPRSLGDYRSPALRERFENEIRPGILQDAKPLARKWSFALAAQAKWLQRMQSG